MTRLICVEVKLISCPYADVLSPCSGIIVTCAAAVDMLGQLGRVVESVTLGRRLRVRRRGIAAITEQAACLPASFGADLDHPDMMHRSSWRDRCTLWRRWTAGCIFRTGSTT